MRHITLAEALATLDVDEPRRSTPGPAARSSSDKLIARVQELTDPAGELFRTGPAVGPKATLMNGAAGIAYYLLRVAELTGDPAALAAADVWAERALLWAEEPRGVVDDSVGLASAVIGTVSPYHTQVRDRAGACPGRACSRRRLDVAPGDPKLHRPGAAPPERDGSHARRHECPHGLLAPGQVPYNMREHQQATQRLLHDVIRHGDAAAEVVQRTVQKSLHDRSSSLTYAGGAHGWAGVLYALMKWWRNSHHDVDDVAVAARLDELAARAVPSGEGLVWPMRTTAGKPSFMNSWCHGSPGQIYVWNLAHQSFGATDYAAIAELAVVAVRDEAGLNLTLSCGQAGHVFALLNQFRHSRDEKWRRTAEARTQEAVARAGDLPGGT